VELRQIRDGVIRERRVVRATSAARTTRSTGPNPAGGWLEMSGEKIQPSWLPQRTGVQSLDAVPRIVTWLPYATVVMMPPERLGWLRQLAFAAPAVSM